jgi:hypothetical protein
VNPRKSASRALRANPVNRVRRAPTPMRRKMACRRHCPQGIPPLASPEA